MNVIVGNTQQNLLSNLDIDIIKSITGTYAANEIVEMFKNFFFNKMILDITALKDYNDISSYQILASGLDPDKIICFLPEKDPVCTANFLSALVSLGIYNFTTNIEGVKYLLRHSNTLNDVAQFKKVSPQIPNPQYETNKNIEMEKPELINDIAISNNTNSMCKIIGVKNVTEGAGATTLIYMMKKQLTKKIGSSVIAIEVDKNDFQLFGDKNMLSTHKEGLRTLIGKHNTASIILVDLNNSREENMCNETIYLLEPSIIKLNKLLKNGVNILTKYKNKRVILNKSLLSNQDVSDFEYESSIKIFYNMPPLDERKNNEIVDSLLLKLGLINNSGMKTNSSSRVFGLFRR